MNSQFQVFEGKDVDLISPFPVSALPQASKWMYRYKSLMFGDDGPQGTPEVQAFLEDRMRQPNIHTWAVVDKFNLTQSDGAAPLVGIVFFELSSPHNGYVHLASTRAAWGNKIASPGLMDQGCEIVKEQLWKIPTLQRISVATFNINRPALALAKRLGFKQDGHFSSMSQCKGQPVDVIHFGCLRPVPEEVVDEPKVEELVEV